MELSYMVQMILQNRNRDTDVENKYVDAKRGNWSGDELGDWD